VISISYGSTNYNHFQNSMNQLSQYLLYNEQDETTRKENTPATMKNKKKNWAGKEKENIKRGHETKPSCNKGRDFGNLRPEHLL